MSRYAGAYTSLALTVVLNFHLRLAHRVRDRLAPVLHTLVDHDLFRNASLLAHDRNFPLLLGFDSTLAESVLGAGRSAINRTPLDVDVLFDGEG